MRRTFLWRLLKRSESLKRLRRFMLRLARRGRRRLTPNSSELGEGSVLYLTFDDGPDPIYSPQILDLLARYGAHAVFFVIGSRVEQAPDVVERIIADGHRLGNHTWDHVPLAGLTRSAFDDQIVRTQELLRWGSAQPPTAMRPPYGSMDRRTRQWADEVGVDVVLWDIDPMDWDRPGTDHIVRAIVDEASTGDVVLLHDGGGDRDQTVSALETVLEDLTARGVSFPLLPERKGASSPP